MRGAAKRVAAEERQAEIIDLAEDGRGVARADGKVVFIRGALPGERVRYRLLRSRKQADEGDLVAVELASPDRREPLCAHFGTCGGCSLQHLSPDGQRLAKQKHLLDALQRIGKVQPEQVAAPVIGPDWGYRRRARLSVKHVPVKGGVLVGFREVDSPYVAKLEQCHTLDARVGKKLRELAACVEQLDLKTVVPQVEVAAVEDAVVLVFRVMAAPSNSDREALRNFGRDSGFTIYLQPGGLDSVAPLDPPGVELLFTPDGSDLRAAFRPTDFIQVNDTVNQQMVRQALDWIAPQHGEKVLELFCGLGNFTLPLARRGAQVTAVEGDAALVAGARANAKRNGLDIHYEMADLFKTDWATPWLKQSYGAALLDPPRAGAREILPAVAAARPSRILYVSCHPGTLARDAGYLVHEAGYTLGRVGILDMFPHTAHVETMALFERRPAG